jgi:hypothetical protein
MAFQGFTEGPCLCLRPAIFLMAESRFKIDGLGIFLNY